MKSKTKDIKNQKNIIKPVKVNLIYNIPKTKSKKDINIVKPKLIKNNTSNNPINLIDNQNIKSEIISEKGNINLIKNISNYISFNKSILLSAYEESLLILFDSLKSYLKNDIIFFNKLKDNFIKNVHNYYQKNKNNFSLNKNNFCSLSKNNKNTIKKEEIKIDNYLTYKTNLKITKQKPNNDISFHKKNKSHINKSISKIISGLSENSINKTNASNQNTINNKNIKKKYLEFSNNNKNKEIIIKKKSLYSLIKSNNKPLISNSPIKSKNQKDYKFSLLNNFVDYNKKIKNNNPSSIQNGSTLKSEIKLKNSEGEGILKKNKDNNKFSIDTNSINKNEMNDNYINNININNDMNNNIIINNIKVKTPHSINNDLINCIKNTLDENLKGMFDFSYESFLNKESEREGI